MSDMKAQGSGIGAQGSHASLGTQHPARGTRHLAPSTWYACLHLLPVAEPTPATTILTEIAQEFSPRYQQLRDDLIVIDISGLDRLLGGPHTIGEELRRSTTTRGVRVQIAVAATQTTAIILALGRPGVTVVRRGDEPHAVAPIGIGILQKIAEAGGSGGSDRSGETRWSAVDIISTLKRWGVKTLGELTALPLAELTARFGQQATMWHGLARGQDVAPLVPTLAAERFEASMALEWPIEGLEPLSFVLTRLLEPLSTRLERRDRGAAALHVTLGLVVHHDINHREHRGSFEDNSVNSVASVVSEGDADTYTRSLQLPTPMRDVRTLRTLILLDLESHPPPAPIEHVTIVIDPTPGRICQHALFVRAHPTPEQLSTLLARLNALMGEDRVGSPTLVDSYRPGAFEMKPFEVNQDRGRRGVPSASSLSSTCFISSLRRCRRPVPARVTVVDGRPTAVTTDRRGYAGGRVLACAGPWRTSGAWWAGEAPILPSWNRDEWDVSLSDGVVYRIFQDRIAHRWFIDAIFD